MVVNEKKQQYFARLLSLFEEYDKIFLVGVDNVGSKQMQSVRMALRGHGELLMGKNTLIRKAMRQFVETNPKLEALVPHVKGNIGFVFVKDDLVHCRDIIANNKVPAPARAGAIANKDVFVPAGNTGMEPTQTSFFQALNIPTKIARGTIEILNDVHLIKDGQKVGSSEATLLAKLDIRPFEYGLTMELVYEDGSTYEPFVLDLTDDDLAMKFNVGLRNMAALSLASNLPTLASVPHSLVNSYKNLLAVAVSTDYTFPLAEKVKAYLADPSAFATAAPAATGGDAPAAEAAKEESEEEESDDDMGFSLFD